MIRCSLWFLLFAFACGCTDTTKPGFKSQPGDTAIVGVTVVPSGAFLSLPSAGAGG
jgi:hypothetical protein